MPTHDDDEEKSFFSKQNLLLFVLLYPVLEVEMLYNAYPLMRNNLPFDYVMFDSCHVNFMDFFIIE